MEDKPHIKVIDGKYTANHQGRIVIADTLTNIMSGLNTSSDPRTHNQFNFLNYGLHNEDYLYNQATHLYAAYRSSWLARQIVNIPAKDMTRNWRTFKCEGAEDIMRHEKLHQVRRKVANLLSASRLAGGAAGVMLIDGQDLAEPLDVTRVKKGGFLNMQVFDRYELTAGNENVTSPLADNFLMPEYYDIANTETRIHHSNIVLMNGETLPRQLARLQSGWGDSALRKCMEDLTDVLASRSGLAALLQKANADILKTDGLKSAVTSEMENQVQTRLQLFKMGLSNHNLGVLDVTEDLIRQGVSFGGLADVLNQLMVWTAGAADIPMTRLFNEQSKGFGDSGAGDQKNYYDGLSGEQEDRLRPALECLDEVLVRSALGYMPDDCDFEFNPLYQASGIEQAQERLAESQADMQDLEAGVATVSQVQKRRQASDIYQYDDDKIEKLETFEDEQFESMIGGDDEEEDLFRAVNRDEPTDGGAEKETEEEKES